MVSRQDATKLLSYFDGLYEKKYGRKYKGNRYSDSWGFKDIIEDLGMEQARLLVGYYFKLASPDHSRSWFIYHYNEIYDNLLNGIKDARERQYIREETRRRTEELNEG